MDMHDLEQAGEALLIGLRATLQTELTSIWLPIQLGLIVLALLAAAGITALIRKRVDLTAATMGWPPYLRLIARAVAANFWQLIFIVLMMLTRVVLNETVERPRVYLLDVAVNLATAWVVIAIVTSVIRNRVVNRVVATIAWTIAALSILKLLDPIVRRLDSVAVPIGGLRVTPLLVLKTTAFLLLALWAANAASNFFEKRVHGLSDLTPSVQELISKLIRIALITVAVVIVMSSVGIDLSVIAVFSGAIGVGIGFGLQKIVSNLVSGIILLADKSIKPGDIISVGEHFGQVGHMGARYTLVDTRDGREYLIPNEDFVTQRVVNWSYSSSLVRLEVKFGTTYASEPRRTQAAAIAAALSVKRVQQEPAPICHLLAFGQSSLDFMLAFWIRDPIAGVNSVRSDVLLALWDTLEKEGIAIPKPGPARMIIERAL